MDDAELYAPVPGPPVPLAAPTPPVVTHAAAPADRFGRQRKSLRSRIGGIFAAVVAALAKFFTAIKAGALVLFKLKVFATAGTALISVAAYSLAFGWTFGVGLVVLLFIHEMGHVIQLRREGVQASAPMFIPFMGAFIAARSLGENAYAEAKVGLAGPVLGTAGAALCWGVAEATNSDMLRALAYVGFLINLFNLLPIVPLDGGRAMAAMAPAMWFIGLGVLVALVLIAPNPFLLIILVLGGYSTWQRWQQRRTRSLEQAAYYRISTRARLLVGVVYIGLIVLLAFGMYETHILASGGHDFSRL
jgi:Zn-dependent protease